MIERLNTIRYLIAETENAVTAAFEADDMTGVDYLETVLSGLYKEEAKILPKIEAEKLRRMHSRGQYLNLRR